VVSSAIQVDHQAVRGIDFAVAASHRFAVEVKVERVPWARSRHGIPSVSASPAHVKRGRVRVDESARDPSLEQPTGPDEVLGATNGTSPSSTQRTLVSELT